jgi:hypothetical protein
MANGEKKDSSITFRFLDSHFEHMKPDLKRLKEAGRNFTASVMACMIEGEYTFRRNPGDIVRYREMWRPIENESSRKNIRAPENFSVHFSGVAKTFRVDLNSFIIASVHRNLSFFADNPEMVDIVYREWAEKQLANCMAVPRQTCMTECVPAPRKAI